MQLSQEYVDILRFKLSKPFTHHGLYDIYQGVLAVEEVLTRKAVAI